jgi:hypothetical protein
MRSTSVTVGTTPTLLVAADDLNRYVYLHVIGNTGVYLGGSTVTTATGTLTEKHTSPIELFIPSRQTLYGVVATATEDVRVLTPDVD